ARVVRQDVEGKGDDEIHAQAKKSFKVVGFAVLDQEDHDERRQEEGHRLEGFEVEGHGSIHGPAEYNQEGSDEDCNLQTRANGDANGQVHLVLPGHNDCGDVFGSIPNNGDQDKTNEGLANVCLLNNRIDTANEIIGANSDQDGDKY